MGCFTTHDFRTPMYMSRSLNRIDTPKLRVGSINIWDDRCPALQIPEMGHDWLPGIAVNIMEGGTECCVDNQNP